jgi:hypothetical protein
MTMRHGRCLCGSVTFAADVASRDVIACHCDMCRHWTAGPLMTVEHKGAVAFTGAENIGIYRASNFAERGFCRQCGSALYWKLRDKDHYWLSAGALEDPAGMHLAEELFIDAKPAFYAFSGETRKVTSADYAAFMSASADKA